MNRAYPRSRGGTDLPAAFVAAVAGLSPLARGNHGIKLMDVVRRGPIPARAGEPQWCTLSIHPSGAYPRSRGGTSPSGSARTSATGLSPLARGNL